jgi:hypothetical protein
MDSESPIRSSRIASNLTELVRHLMFNVAKEIVLEVSSSDGEESIEAKRELIQLTLDSNDKKEGGKLGKVLIGLVLC